MFAKVSTQQITCAVVNGIQSLRYAILPMFLWWMGLSAVCAQAPVVSNVVAQQRSGTKLVDITYDVTAVTPTVNISLRISNDGGASYNIPATTLSGAVGDNVTTGTGKVITWNAGVDWNGNYNTDMRFEVTADDGMIPPVIITEPTSQTIVSGSTATLTVTASGSSPLTYQWYQGAVGTTTTPVGTNSASFTTPVLSATTNYWVRVSNSVGSVNSTLTTLSVPEFALIPAGAFQMGVTSGDTDSNAPSVSVTVSAFYMGKNEVTKSLWDEVRTWAAANGYTDLAIGGGKATNHPVHSVSWWDVVKWCNARSQKEGLTPCYTVSGAVMKTGTTAPTVNWTANGYRLPTEAEWEKAARGGVSGKRFPWGTDTISQSQSNYYASTSYSYDSSGSMNNYHPTYNDGTDLYTSPVSSFAANGYGLHDMAGNVSEWCWDWYGESTYVNGATDPRGSASGGGRLLRGGSWASDALQCRAADRFYFSVTHQFVGFGFRVARSSLDQQLIITTQPTSQTIVSGSSATLTVTASGSSPLTYQWYQGAVGATTTPVGTNSASFTTPVLSATTNYWVRVSNSAGSVNSSLATVTVVSVPADIAFIPGGAFQMGVTSGDTDSNAPSVSVTVSAFYMGKNEVTKALWDEVRTWAAANGYTDLSTGAGKASNHPVQRVSWWDVVKWCNARSEKEGLTPCYTVSGAAMKTGTIAPTVNWSANGYRLPTEAEWEKAARGGVSGTRFPWGADTISHSQANYYALSSYSYDLSGSVSNFHPTYYTGSVPYTSPVGSFASNAYGLNDMAANVWEWCWDWYGDSTYVNGATNPRGATSGSNRVIRGGGWSADAFSCRAANRFNYDPSDPNGDIGLRIARSLVP